MEHERPNSRVLPIPPRGAFCAHKRMRYRRCSEECCANGRFCQVNCPDCGLTWSFFEGVYG